MHHVIIGNGVAGITAAFTIREREPEHEITVISGETDYYYSRTALMYIAMNELRTEDTEPFERRTYAENNIKLLRKLVTRINPSEKSLKLEDGGIIKYDSLLLATGALPSAHPAIRQELEGVCCFVSYQDLQDCMRLIPEALKRRGKALVIGGGLIGIELCEVFLHHGLEVDFIIRGESFFRKELSLDEGRFTEKYMAEQGLRVYTGTTVSEIEENAGRVTAVTCDNGRRVSCDIIGLAAGVVPNTKLAEASGIPRRKGIRCNWKLETAYDDVFSAGDCVEISNDMKGKGFIRTIWYSARDMGEVAGRNMLGDDVLYDPGPWYNSAKFFEKEYTACGQNDPSPQDGMEHYHYQDPGGANSVRINHKDGRLRGFSMIGGRWDHSVLLRFIAEHRSLDYFFNHYKEALFDPEFYPHPLVKEAL